MVATRSTTVKEHVAPKDVSEQPANDAPANPLKPTPSSAQPQQLKSSTNVFFLATTALACMMGGMAMSSNYFLPPSPKTSQVPSPETSQMTIPPVMDTAIDLTRRVEKMHTLYEWFQVNGGELNKNVELRAVESMPHVWGLFAKGKIEAGETLTKVPHKLHLYSLTALETVFVDIDRLKAKSSLPNPEIITPSMIMEAMELVDENGTTPEVLTKDIFALRDLASHTSLALMMVIEWDNPESFFYPYFDTLPEGCQMSVCWSVERKQRELSQEMIDYLWDEEIYYEAVADALGLDYPNLLQKISLVASRCWGAGNQSVLVPFTDMVNHLPETSYNDFLDEGGSELTLSEDGPSYEKGDEVFDNYGEKHNGQLYAYYGFTMNDNPFDTCAGLQEYLSDEFMDERNLWPEDEVCPRQVPTSTLRYLKDLGCQFLLCWCSLYVVCVGAMFLFAEFIRPGSWSDIAFAFSPW
eukprot:gb/GEZN01005065.1/.p1 GENE.gb/GEZN01005065.1/~~gb/GEZN01005065.1/.p1  ORF type:complete len:480 (-),score=61.00 gb/GEZN01005065.1/:415-1815(-)